MATRPSLIKHEKWITQAYIKVLSAVDIPRQNCEKNSRCLFNAKRSNLVSVDADSFCTYFAEKVKKHLAIKCLTAIRATEPYIPQIHMQMLDGHTCHGALILQTFTDTGWCERDLMDSPTKTCNPGNKLKKIVMIIDCCTCHRAICLQKFTDYGWSDHVLSGCPSTTCQRSATGGARQRTEHNDASVDGPP